MAKYSFVIPVHNGGVYLKQCIGSVLQQTLTDFDVVILENDSTDGTREWLEGIDDPRVKIYPSQRLLPIQDNWSRITEVPRAEYMTILPADDMVDPHFLSTFETLLNEDPDRDLYHAHFRLIDEEGRVVRRCNPRPLQEGPTDFIKAIMVDHRETFATGYIFRSSVYDAVGGIPQFEKLLYADFALWLLLMRNTGIVTSPTECFSFRIHKKSTTASSNWRSYVKALYQFTSFLHNYRQDLNAEERQIFQQCEQNFIHEFFVYWLSDQAKRSLIKGNKIEVFRMLSFLLTHHPTVVFTRQWLYLLKRLFTNNIQEY